MRDAQLSFSWREGRQDPGQRLLHYGVEALTPTELLRLCRPTSPDLRNRGARPSGVPPSGLWT